MNLLDSIKVPVGHFQLDSYDAFTGQLLQHIEGSNIVVNDGRTALARLLGNSGAYGGVTTWYVDTMKFGKGGHNPADVLEMVEVLVTNDDLYDQTAAHITIDQDVTGSTTWPAERKVTFEATVEADEGNGSGTLEYSEAGLYYDSGSVMFAHKSFGYIVKNNTIKLLATWTFTF